MIFGIALRRVPNVRYRGSFDTAFGAACFPCVAKTTELSFDRFYVHGVAGTERYLISRPIAVVLEVLEVSSGPFWIIA